MNRFLQAVFHGFPAGKGLLFFALPFLVAGARIFIAGVFGACGVPSKVSMMTSDMVLFFLVSVALFSALNDFTCLSDFGGILNPFREIAMAIRYAGLH